MVEVSTSVLSVKDEATKEFYNIEVAGTNYFHIDVMDGKFVENDTTERMFEYATILKHISNIGIDVHLMCENIDDFTDSYLGLTPDSITFHVEAIKNKEQAMKIINNIKHENVKVGIAINPDTELEKIYEYLPYVHKVLVMTVVPGKGGQKLILSTIDKIKKLKEYLLENNLDTIIEADGGINDENINQLAEAGVDIVVAGMYIIGAENKREAILKLKIDN